MVKALRASELEPTSDKHDTKAGRLNISPHGPPMTQHDHLTKEHGAGM